MTFTVKRLARDDGTSIALYQWPEPSGPIRAAVQIAHGLAEHAGRYDRFAQALTRAGYAVYASDHRGHGQTATRPSEYGHFGDRDGFAKVVADLYAVNRSIASELPGVGRILFGHSFGSFAAQAYLYTHGDTLAAAVLSGTNSGVAKLLKVGIGVAYIERFRLGPKNRSALLQKLSFGNYNRAFEPTRTEFDWLSRDAAEVDKYVNDPLCGFDVTTQAWVDLMGGLIEIEQPKNQARVPKSLPVYLFAGSDDPVGQASKGPRILAKAYERQGLERVTLELYSGARHEMLNEINRDEVVADVIAWLDKQLAARDAASSAPLSYAAG
jgi:alpha-beta hydrolase superfamily lysophospholipase